MKKNHNQRYSNGGRKDFSKNKDIDQMMQESGMFDKDYEYSRSKKNGGKRNNRGRNRDQY